MRNILRCALLSYGGSPQPRSLIWLQVLLVFIGYLLGLAEELIGRPNAFAILLVTLIFVSFFLASPIGRTCGHPIHATRRRLFLLSFPFYRSEVILGEWLALAMSGSALFIAGVIGFMGAIETESNFIHIALFASFFWAVFALVPFYIFISSTRIANHPAIPVLLTFLVLPLIQFAGISYAGRAESLLSYLPGSITLQTLTTAASSFMVVLYELRTSLFWGLLFILISIFRLRNADLFADAY